MTEIGGSLTSIERATGGLTTYTFLSRFGDTIVATLNPVSKQIDITGNSSAVDKPFLVNFINRQELAVTK